MPKLEEIFSVDPEVLALLGVTTEQLAEMTTGEFARLSYEKGIVWSVNMDGGRVKGLTIMIKRDENVVTG